MAHKALTRTDTAWLHMDSPTNLMVVTGFFRFERPITLDRIKAAANGGLLKFDRFRSRIDDKRGFFARPRWVEDPDFDLNRHIVTDTLAEPGDDAALRQAIEARVGVPLDSNHPLWEMHLLQGYGSGCVLFFRIHHCIADGIALMQVLLSMCDASEDARAAVPRSKPKRPWWFWALLPITSVLWLLHFLWITTWLMIRPKDPDTVYRAKLSGTKRTAWTHRLPLDKVKAVANASGCKINDLLLATLSGALRDYAASRGRPMDKPVRVMVPVNLRGAKAAGDLGNSFALVTPTLPVNEAVAASRLRTTKKRMDALKRSPEPLAVVVLLVTLGMIGARMQRALMNFLVRKASAVVTNVPGPRTQLSFAGEPIDDIQFWVPTSGATAVGISIFSYRGFVTLGVMVDEAAIPDAQSLADAIESEFQALCESVRAYSGGQRR
ncbi:MAG: diacylglycerol O-acyltransferase [Myxococcota bacterium]|jgi:diacylglycerol O-acyltransferase